VQRRNLLHEAAKDRSFWEAIGAARRARFKEPIVEAVPTDASFRRDPKADDRTADGAPPIR
jgi:hypothetical protein